MEEGKMQLHVVMVPWLAYGHINAFLQLAKKLESRGLRISLVSAPLNITRIKQQILPPGIDLEELQLPHVEGLPNGVESTADLKRGGTFGLLMESMDGWEKPFEALLRRLSPDFVIHDMTQYWAPRIAAKMGIPTMFFVTTSAAGTGFLLGQEAVAREKGITPQDLAMSPPGFPSSLICRQLFEARKDLHVYEKKEGHISPAERWKICSEGSWVMVINTCLDLEGAYMEYLQRTTGRAVMPVGILMPSLPPQPPEDSSLAWLDRQVPRSVVVVSFGSESTLASHDLAALALGLEDARVPFLFVLLRRMATELPQGFVTRTQGRGLLVTDWAPQLHILSHFSTAAFLTHCGWNSVTEGLRFGIPLVALPLQHDQGLNAKLIAQELKLGVEVRRNEEDGSFGKEDICKALWSVMVEEEGRQIRSNVENISRVFTSQVYERNIDNFVSVLKERASYRTDI